MSRVVLRPVLVGVIIFHGDHVPPMTMSDDNENNDRDFIHSCGAYYRKWGLIMWGQFINKSCRAYLQNIWE